MIISHRPFCGPLKPPKSGDKILNILTENRYFGKSLRNKVNQLTLFQHLRKECVVEDFFTSVVPTLTYCYLVWSTCSVSLMQELEHIHARAAKIIHRISSDTSDKDDLQLT